MTDTKMLEDYIDKSGYKKSYIADKLGLTTYGFMLKVKGNSEFKSSEIVSLCDILKIDGNDMVNIFLTKK